MKITFGICTSLNCDDDVNRLNEAIRSIKNLNIPQYEIIVAGDGPKTQLKERVQEGCSYYNIYGWITQKKNVLARVAKYDVLVLLHDYFVFDSRWFTSYEQFGYDWDVCSNPQFLINGDRHFTDWVLWDHPKYPRYTSLEYMNYSHTKYQYISGGYFLVKKQFLLDNLFNESLVPGDPEDVEWSLRIRDKARIVCNPAALVIHNKPHRDLGRWGFPFQQDTHWDYVSYTKKVLGYDQSCDI